MKKYFFLFLLASEILSAQNIITSAGTGQAGFSGDGGQATSAQIWGVSGVVTDNYGNVYITDAPNQRIRKVTLSGIITTIIGNGTAGFSGDGGLALLAEINNPRNITIDDSGNIYIADTYNQRIRKVNSSGIISTIAGNGTVGYSGDGSAAISARLNYPRGVAVDDSGNIFIADYYNNVIRKINTLGIISTFAGNGTAGYSGDGSPAISAKLNNPEEICFDTSGNLFIADFNNSVIRKVNSTGIISTVAGTGTSGFAGDNGLALSAQLSFPSGITFDAGNNLYIADTGNERIRKVSVSGIITTIAGNGQSGYAGDGGPAVSAILHSPTRVAVDAYGNVYIADLANNRIREVIFSGTGVSGISENNFDFSVSPNPSSGNITVYVTQRNYTVTIFNSLGEIAYSEKSSEEKMEIESRNFSIGIYFVQVKFEKKIITKKIVKE